MSTDYTISHDESGAWITFPDGTRMRSMSGGQLGNTTLQQQQTRAPLIPGPGVQEQTLTQANTPALTGQDFTLGNAMNQEAAYLNSGPGGMYPGIQGLGGLAGQNLAGNLSGMQTFSPDTVNMVMQAYQAPVQAQMLALKNAANDAAAARGMSISDAPIGSSYMLNLQQMLNQATSGEAGAILGQQNTQNQLDQSLLNFAQQTQAQGIGLQGQLAGINPPGNTMQATLGNQRIQSAGQNFTNQQVGTQPTATTLGSLGSTLFGNQGAVGGIGNILTGAANLGIGGGLLSGLATGNSAANTPSITSFNPNSLAAQAPLGLSNYFGNQSNFGTNDPLQIVNQLNTQTPSDQPAFDSSVSQWGF